MFLQRFIAKYIIFQFIPDMKNHLNTRNKNRALEQLQVPKKLFNSWSGSYLNIFGSSFSPRDIIAIYMYLCAWETTQVTSCCLTTQVTSCCLRAPLRLLIDPTAPASTHKVSLGTTRQVWVYEVIRWPYVSDKPELLPYRKILRSL